MIAVDASPSADPRPALLDAGRALSAHGWTPATSGNLSARAPEGFWVTASGLDKGSLTLHDLLLVDAEGRCSGPRRPSAETALHAQLYARDPATGCVLHVHSRAATVLSRVLSTDALVLEGYEICKAFLGVTTHARALRVPLIANSQDVAELCAAIGPRLDGPGLAPGYLIRGHGLYTWGPTVGDALRHAEALDFLFSCELDLWRIRP